MNQFDCLVLGGGPAGVTAALRARELGASVALVEARRLGGTCTNDGCVPVRALAHAARLVRESTQLGDYGIACERARPDFVRLMERAAQVVRDVHSKKDLAGTLRRAGVELFDGAGEARFTGPHSLHCADGRSLSAKKFILCVGGHPRTLNCPGGDLALTSNQIWAIRSQPARMAVIGASATGCQLASIFNALGTKVTLLDMAPRILPAIDADASTALTQAFARRGLDVITGIGAVERIDQLGGGVKRITFRAADRPRTLDAELILVSIGWPGNVPRLNPQAAGIEVERGFVKVNDRQQSVSAPHVFAAGDSDGTVMLVQAAQIEGNLAAENAVLGADRVCTHHVVPHGGFTDPEYGSVGLTEEAARAQHGNIVAASVTYDELDRAVIDDRREGLCKLIVDRPTRRVLGVHVVGEDATEVVQIVAAAMVGNLPVDGLARVEFSYPTFTAIVGLAAREAVRQLGGASNQAAEWEHAV